MEDEQGLKRKVTRKKAANRRDSLDEDSDIVLTVGLNEESSKRHRVTASFTEFSLPSLCLRPLSFGVKPFIIYLVKDCGGLTCFILITFLLNICSFLANLFIFRKWESFLVRMSLFVISNALSSFASCSHWKAMTTSPGVKDIQSFSESQAKRLKSEYGWEIRKCSVCVAIKEPGTSHCSTCKRCVREMDHHCPWINNCVGRDNMRYFLMFTAYTSLHCLNLMIQIVLLFATGKVDLENPQSFVVLPIYLILFILALFFFFFAISMFCTTISSVYDGITYIETIKNQKDKDRERGLKKFRTMFPTFWSLFPTTVDDLKSGILIFLKRDE